MVPTKARLFLADYNNVRTEDLLRPASTDEKPLSIQNENWGNYNFFLGGGGGDFTQ